MSAIYVPRSSEQKIFKELAAFVTDFCDKVAWSMDQVHDTELRWNRSCQESLERKLAWRHFERIVPQHQWNEHLQGGYQIFWKIMLYSSSMSHRSDQVWKQSSPSNGINLGNSKFHWAFGQIFWVWNEENKIESIYTERSRKHIFTNGLLCAQAFVKMLYGITSSCNNYPVYAEVKIYIIDICIETLQWHDAISWYIISMMFYEKSCRYLRYSQIFINLFAF